MVLWKDTVSVTALYLFKKSERFDALETYILMLCIYLLICVCEFIYVYIYIHTHIYSSLCVYTQCFLGSARFIIFVMNFKNYKYKHFIRLRTNLYMIRISINTCISTCSLFLYTLNFLPQELMATVTAHWWTEGDSTRECTRKSERVPERESKREAERGKKLTVQVVPAQKGGA